MSFFSWAVKRERKNCKEILLSQEDYIPKIKINMSIQPYGVGSIKSYFPVGVERKGHIINLHGGGLIAGSIEQNKNFCLMLAEQGYVIHAIEYPLIPEVTFERQIGSVCDMIIHLNSLIGEEKKYLVADSAGCLLAIIVNALLSDGVWMQEYFNYKSSKSAIYFDGMWLNCPLFETVGFNKVGIFMAKGLYGKKPAYKKLLKNPYNYFAEYLPKNTVFVISPHDSLRKQAFKMMQVSNSLYIGDKYKKNHNHDWNVIYPNIDEITIRINMEALREMTKC